MIEIDGSQKSGSGTILRYSLTIASLLNKELRIYNIRLKREKAGLRPQHLKTVEAFRDLTEAKVEGASLNSREIIFRPKKNFIKSGKFNWDIGTAGSTVMMGLAILPLGFFAKGPSTYRISGGLFQDFAPNAYHTRFVLFEILKKFSLEAQINIVKPGYVPMGGGIIEIFVEPVKEKITPLKLLEQGKVIKIEGISLSSNLAERKVSERMASECNKILNKRGFSADIKIINDTKAKQRGAALLIWAKTDTGCIIGSDMAGKIGRPAETIGESVASNLLEDIKTKATVDRFLADQIILYAALADGESEYIIPRMTDHIESNLCLVREILGAEVSISGNILKMKGVGFKRNTT